MFRTTSSVPRVAGRAISAASRSATSPASLQASPTATAIQRQYHVKSYTRPVAFRVSPAVISGRRLYHEKVLDHYSRPRNVGSMPKTDTDVGTGLVGAPACGDVMKLQIRVDPSNNTISDVKFKTFGCGSAIASSSYLTELVRGMTLEEAGRVRNTEIAKELCLPPVKLHCSMLAEDAIKSAISNYYTKNPTARTTDLGGTGATMPKIDVETVMDPAPTAAA